MSFYVSLAWASLLTKLVLAAGMLYFWHLARQRRDALRIVALTLEDIARNACEHDVKAMAASRARTARRFSGERGQS